MTKDKIPATLLDSVKAKSLAEQLTTEDDDDWSYKAVQVPNTSWWKVESYDEIGNFMGYM